MRISSSSPFPRAARGLLMRLGLLASMLLVASPAQAAIRIWVGGQANVLWSNGANWVGGQGPSNGDVVIVSSSAASGIGVVGSSIALASLTIDHAYNLSGLSNVEVTIGAGGITITALPASAPVVINVPLRLGADQIWKSDASAATIGRTIALNGGNHLRFRVASGAELECDDAISGSGSINKDGPGVLVFSGDSTYAGPTMVEEGYLRVAHAHALGLANGAEANGTFVTGDGSKDGSIHFANVAVGNEALNIQGFGQSENGALQASGTASIAGPLVVNSDIEINVIAPSRLTFLGPISGPGRLKLTHDGTFAFANSNNTYTGGLGIGESGNHLSKVVLEADEAIVPTPLQLVPEGTVLTLDSGVTQTLFGLGGTGTVRLTDSTSFLNLNAAVRQTVTFPGHFSGSGVVRHVGLGRYQFTGVSSFNGRLNIDHGTVGITVASFQANVTVNADGNFEPIGTAVKGLTLNDGTLTLVPQGNASNLVTAQDFVMTPTSQLVTSAANDGFLSRLHVADKVVLGGSLSVTLSPAFHASLGQNFTLIHNDGADPIVGTFAGLPHGAILTTAAGKFQVLYNAGDGNDVVLTLIAVNRDYLLSEGATGGFFTTDILIANPTLTPAPVRISFLKPGGGNVDLETQIEARSRKTITANDVAGLGSTEFSTVVHSTTGVPLVVERTMTWDRQVGYGAHTERATEAAAKKWYFAEGAQGFFSTFLLLANPNDGPSVASVEYLIEGGAPVTRTYDVPALSRRTIDLGADPALVTRSFGMVVTFTEPGLAERAMYFGVDPLWRGGHDSAGVPAPSTTAFVAEGATGSFFATYILIANPNPAPVNVDLTFARQGDTPIKMARSIAASSRLTLDIESLDPGLANVAVSTSVVASAPVVVERAQYWPDPSPQWYEAHSSPALQALGQKWGLAEGRVGGGSAYQTYILIANTNNADAHVTITFLRENDAPPIEKTFVVPATQRLTVQVGPGTEVPELQDERFGALLVSDQPIAVERAMYSNAGGQLWAAGTSANATPVP